MEISQLATILHRPNNDKDFTIYIHSVLKWKYSSISWL